MDRSGTGLRAGLCLDGVALRTNPRKSLQIDSNKNHANIHTKEARVNLGSPGNGALGTIPSESERQGGKRSCRGNINQ